ncbi:ABC transporter permease [Flavobacteriales bacterium]|nr:ABC transporter permease [Flavobacteriales bacterium]
MQAIRAFFRNEPTALLGAAWIALWTIVATTSTLWRPDPTPHANDQHLEWSMLSPGESVEAFLPTGLSVQRTFLLGTDRFGRDYFSRVVAGSGLSLAVGLIAVLLSLLIGIPLGALAGYLGGRFDAAVSWLLQVVWSIPTLLLVLALTLAFGKGFEQVFLAIGLSMWVEVARVVRGQVIALRNVEWVEAGRVLGLSTPRIVFLHILPNLTGPIAVIASANFAAAILIEAGLSFMGVGAQIPMPSWGNLIRDHYGAILTGHAHLALVPGACIVSLVLAFNALSNAFARFTAQR